MKRETRRWTLKERVQHYAEALSKIAEGQYLADGWMPGCACKQVADDALIATTRPLQQQKARSK
jgi:hypothetical protein